MSRPADDGEHDTCIFDIPDANADPAEDAWNCVRLDLVRTLLLRLPASQRTVIELAYFSGLTQPEIAERLSQPLGTVKTRTRLALRRLKVWFEEELPGELSPLTVLACPSPPISV
jgi:RNA polymerase sigma factor (sigma-70 family)